jgi:hypothetical protein
MLIKGKLCGEIDSFSVQKFLSDHQFLVENSVLAMQQRLHDPNGSVHESINLHLPVFHVHVLVHVLQSDLSPVTSLVEFYVYWPNTS